MLVTWWLVDGWCVGSWKWAKTREREASVGAYFVLTRRFTGFSFGPTATAELFRTFVLGSSALGCVGGALECGGVRRRCVGVRWRGSECVRWALVGPLVPSAASWRSAWAPGSLFHFACMPLCLTPHVHSVYIPCCVVPRASLFAPLICVCCLSLIV